MTPEQAKTKWCPFSSGAEPRDSVRDEMPTPAWSRCIAAQCMAWRWTVQPHDAPDPQGAQRHYPGNGYCGLVPRET